VGWRQPAHGQDPRFRLPWLRVLSVRWLGLRMPALGCRGRGWRGWGSRSPVRLSAESVANSRDSSDHLRPGFVHQSSSPILQRVASPVIAYGHGVGPAFFLSLPGPAAALVASLTPGRPGAHGFGGGFRPGAPNHPVRNRESGRRLARCPVGTGCGCWPPGLRLLELTEVLDSLGSRGPVALVVAGSPARRFRPLAAPGPSPGDAGRTFPWFLSLRLPTHPASKSRARIPQGQGGAPGAEGAAAGRRRGDPGPEGQRRALPGKQPQRHLGPGVQRTGQQQGEQGRQQGKQQQASDQVQGSAGGRELGCCRSWPVGWAPRGAPCQRFSEPSSRSRPSKTRITRKSTISSIVRGW